MQQCAYKFDRADARQPLLDTSWLREYFLLQHSDERVGEECNVLVVLFNSVKVKAHVALRID